MAHAIAAHWGYRDGETPRYGHCGCGQVVRLDRLDLLAEHDELCPGPRRRSCPMTPGTGDGPMIDIYLDAHKVATVTPRGLPAALVDELDGQSLALIHEYVCARLRQDRGDRELQVRFKDGRYQRTSVWDADRGVRVRLSRS